MLCWKNKDISILSIAGIVGLIIWFVPPFGGLTNDGIKLLAVFIPTIILWISIGTGWTSFLSLTAITLLQITTDTGSFGVGWGNSISIMVIPMLVIVNVMLDSGAMEYLTKWILSRRIIHGRPYVFMLMLCVAITLIGTAVYAVIMCCFLLTFLESICSSIGYTKTDKFYRAVLFLALWICTIMDGVWPFARPIPVLIMAYLSPLGYEISILRWCAIGVPFAIMSIVVALLIIRFVYRPDVSKFRDYDDTAIREELKKVPLCLAGKMSITSIVIIVVTWLLAGLEIPVVSDYFNSLGYATVPYLCMLVMCLVRIDSKPVIKIETALSHVNWTLVLFIGTMIFYAGIVGQEKYGFTAMIGNFLAPVVELLPYTSIIGIGLFTVCVLTNFMSSTVATTIIITVFMPLLQAYADISYSSVIVFGVMVGCVSNCAYLTHAACPASGVVLAAMPFSVSVKYNLIQIIAILLLTIFAFQPIMSNVI